MKSDPSFATPFEVTLESLPTPDEIKATLDVIEEKLTAMSIETSWRNQSYKDTNPRRIARRANAELLLHMKIKLSHMLPAHQNPYLNEKLD